MTTTKAFPFSRTLVPVLLVLLLNGSRVLAQAVTPKRADGTPSLYGVVSENKYTNEFFGFSFPIPNGFTVIEPEEALLWAKAGGDMLKVENGKTSKDIDNSIAKQATLLAVAERPMGSPGNSALEVVVLKQGNGITANMALVASVSLITSTGKLKLMNSLTNPRFGGLAFAGALVTGEFNSVKISQEMYVIMRRGYSIHVVVTYSTDEGRKSVMGILEKIQFTKL